MDSFGRAIDYLRISVTERCNERCLYCMPEGFKGWSQTADMLTDAEILQIVQTACHLGFRKFRVTGGEPLLRPGLVELLSAIWHIPGVQTLGLSTNGLKLAALAEPLRQSGLRTVNISLDALSPDIYRKITGGSVDAVLAGIHAALRVGFERVKLNCVLMRSVNEDEIWPLIEFAARLEIPLRFIELMPLSRSDVLDASHFLSIGELQKRLRLRDELIPDPHSRLGNGPAKYYRLQRTGALVGFIGALTDTHFCENCNKVRLTADGKLRPCLGQHGEIDLKPALREGVTSLEALFQKALREKPEAHLFRDAYQPQRPMTAIGG